MLGVCIENSTKNCSLGYFLDSINRGMGLFWTFAWGMAITLKQYLATCDFSPSSLLHIMGHGGGRVLASDSTPPYQPMRGVRKMHNYYEGIGP